MVSSPSRRECLAGLPSDLEDLRPLLRAKGNDPYGDGPLATALLNLIESCQKADVEMARQESIFESADAPLTVSELYRARGHLAIAGREISAACRLVLHYPEPLPDSLPSR